MVFPAPLTPNNAKHSPFFNEKESLLTATKEIVLQSCLDSNSYTFLNSWTSIASGYSSSNFYFSLSASITTSSSKWLSA